MRLDITSGLRGWRVGFIMAVVMRRVLQMNITPMLQIEDVQTIQDVTR